MRYMGEMRSRQGVLWRVELWQEGYEGEVGQLAFDADEPLVIEWTHRDKEEVVCGSEATLRIISPGDRTYEDLYTIEAGSIRLDVYRQGELYWSGTLDPEFYEEPYERARDYTVQLTFSDFGIFDRLKYGLTGMQTLRDILLDALQRSGISYTALDAETYCSTYFPGSGEKASPAALAVRSDNFTDEDGEQSTLLEAVTGILQPLALRMVQRCGKVYVYDLNGLFLSAPVRKVKWTGDSQTMGTDKVANNVKVSFSPYSSSELLDGELAYGGTYSVDRVNLTADPGMGYYSYYPDYSEDHKQDGQWDYRLVNFTIFLSDKAEGLAYCGGRYFHILPLVGGPGECSGVAWSFHSGGHGPLSSGMPKQILRAPGKETTTVVMQTRRVFLPKMGDRGADYRVRLSLEMLLDARYNPFSPAGEGNEEDNYEDLKVWTGWAFVPVGVTIYDASGNALCHYVNRPTASTHSVGHIGMATGTWASGAASLGDAYLAYYDAEDLAESAGIQGWKKNRHCIGRPLKDETLIYDSFKKQADGEYMPYPPEGGYLEVTVYKGVMCYDYNQDTAWGDTKRWDDNRLYTKVRWLLYKAPKVELVRNSLVFDEAELDDVEYSGYLNRAAKEEISLDTICGTADTTCPTARGIYVRAADGLQIRQLTRAGVTDHPERLLIGTLYSQYATRHTTLQGEAQMDTGPLCAYTEACQEGKLFLLSEERQDIVADTAETVYTEFDPDHYEAIEPVDEPKTHT